MLLLIFLSILLNCTNLNANQNDTLELEGAYVLPRYPELPSRAWIMGTYEVEVNVEYGVTKEIKVLSSESLGSQGTNIPQENATTMLFVQAIKEALGNWKFRNHQSGSVHSTIVFRMIDIEPRSPSYFAYKVEPAPWNTSSPRIRITVEYHRPRIILN
jgi:hypothetical protein